MKAIKNIIRKLINIMGYNISRINKTNDFIYRDPIIDNDEVFMKIYKKCCNYTMTNKERMYALHKSVEYIIKNNIPGDFVECGVWRGGSTMLIAYSLLEFNVNNRKIYLYDTFEGMSQPTEFDYLLANSFFASELLQKEPKKDTHLWGFATLNEVKNNMALTKYPENNIVYVKGKVEETIPKTIPLKIALLRLDTDWYESTKHELIHLYPILSKNGVLIIDDYGCWAGSKRAVDEYFFDGQILLNRIDSDARIGIKINQ